MQTATPDSIAEHYPEICAGCGVALTVAMATAEAARRVFDLTEPRRREVIEHHTIAVVARIVGPRRERHFPQQLQPRCSMDRGSARS